MMSTPRIIVLVICLLTIQASTVRCLDEDFTFEGISSEDQMLSRNIRDVSPTTRYELKSRVKEFIHNITESIVSILADTKLGTITARALSNTTDFVSNINRIFGSDVLVLKGTNVRINHANLIPSLKLLAIRFLENEKKLKGIPLFFAQRIVFKVLDDFDPIIAPLTTRVNLAVSPQPIAPKGVQTSPQSLLRKLLLDMVVILIRPFQPRLNQTLLNVTNELLSLYKPVLPNNYLQSILSCGINQTVLRAIDIIESIREMLNGLLASSSRLKRSVDAVKDTNVRKTRSLTDLVVGPIRFLVTLILTPVHRFLKVLMNYIFVNLRPIVGKVILSPIESIVMSIISLIPCSRC